ncbi:basic leucine zipper 19-like [Pistacia vera]|uniref:basic leucine zipper 19-like n=1 Tax=Pistacia vera TaxID=55513 RepID=UPI001262F452|nr:basic leucine zipper 19-like [Pistacia vera]
MEGMNKLQYNEKGLPPCCPKRTASKSSPFSVMASTPGSFQVWKKPYFMNHGGSGASSSGGTKSYFSHFDPKTTILPMVNDLNYKKSQNPSPPSDKNPMPSGDNINSAKKTQPGSAALTRLYRNIDPNMDPKRLRRIISNRVSAQKSRLRKLQYLTDMERKVKFLEAQICVLNPQVEIYKNHQRRLEIEQERLNQCMATYRNNNMLRDVEIEENKAEVTRLRQLHLTQLQERMKAQNRMPFWQSAGMNEMAMPGINRSGLETMFFINSNQGQYGENTEEMNGVKQLKLKKLAAETTGVDWLNMNLMQPQNSGQMLMMPGWELGLPVQMPSQPQPPPKEDINLNLGGIEQIHSLNVGQNF